MDVTATEAKNRLGQMLEACQREPVVIEKSGRRHSVLISADEYDALVAAAKGRDGAEPPAPPTAAEFSERYREWIDEQNERVARIGIWNQEFRNW